MFNQVNTITYYIPYILVAHDGSVPSFVPRKRRPRVKSCTATPGLLHQRFVLPDDTVPLENQVAGHMFEHGKSSIGMLKHKDEFILKPITKPMCGERETRFYAELQTSKDPILQQLKQFVPAYHGTKTIAIGGKDVTCLVLDNITKGLKEPCIIDIKIGKRTWDPLATNDKIQNETTKYMESKRDAGFSIPGFQVRNIRDGKLYKYGKDYGKKLNGNSVKEALKLFLNAESGCLCRPLLVQLLGLLWRILHWCRTQRKLRLYSSSLLLVYDARLLRHYYSSNVTSSAANQLNNGYKRSRPPSLILTDTSHNTSTAGFSGQFTSDGPKFERSLSTTPTQIIPTPATAVNNNCPWKKSLRKLQRTHSFANNYEEDLQHLRQNYVYMLDDLVDDSTNVWANVKMIDFAHVFPAEGNTLDTNYLDGIENLVKILEGFLQESY
ncbi:Inositol phosphate kinase 2 [Carabus blaptoides fortunei]